MQSILIWALGIFFACGSGLAEEALCSTHEGHIFPELISLSHTEGKGLGYSKGYSSLGLFLSQPFSDQALVPFADLRGHIFNDGKYAANTGVGLRILSECYKQVWGVYGMYDYLQTSRRPYNQAGGGLEVLGACWDARINVYIPIDAKKNIYRFEYKDFAEMKIKADPMFNLDGLRGREFGLKAREQFALKGVDSLFGCRFCKTCFCDLYAAAGPYYYWGKSRKTKNAFASTHRQSLGGRVVVRMTFWDCLTFECVGSYDKIFKWCGQGQLTFNFPFDFTLKPANAWEQCTVSSSSDLRRRIYEPLQRNEIIAVRSLNRFSDDPRVLDPEFEP